jgi:hypothetical protein
VLEIILLVVLCKSMGNVLRNKGRKPLLFQFLLVGMWLGGEIVGAIIGTVVYAIRNGAPPEGIELSTYLFAIVGAAAGAGLCFLIAHLVPAAEDEGYA